MTNGDRTAQEVLADQFKLTADLCTMTGEYHRLLQRVAATGFARQLAEDGPEPDLIDAEKAELAAQLAAESCDLRIKDLEHRLNALARELAELR
ncbi:hypothetical protein [Haematobacter missouriensis]|uniref:Uncharacterized protein n=1 Tax=Haematobacter missouriensis TaxID=366616 RepID=A0A225D180_9RHOB|nr:hypothetical protein [Haematobacter missouriensis]OWJ70434.1 hypothetical protein CDV53_20630 [Haematobacter missouriensis]OWJ81115.1 hypothetical protein CDV52_19465 [Haematobacter missouriensis]